MVIDNLSWIVYITFDEASPHIYKRRNMDSKQLQQLGLSEKESQVYLALLELGVASVAEIGAKAKINRTTTYDILEYLTSYGIASHAGEESKKHYVAETPENLIAYLDKKSADFKEKSSSAKAMLPELKGIYNLAPRKPKVRFYDGEEGIIAMYEDSLTSKTEILSWLNPEQTTDFSSEYFTNYYKRRAAQGIHIKTIVSDSIIAREIHTRDHAEDREMRIIPKGQMDIGPECYVYGNKVSFMSVREKFGVMVESKDVAEAQRKLFSLAWTKAKDLSILE